MTALQAFLFQRRYLLAGFACGFLIFAGWFKVAGAPAVWKALGVPAASKPYMDTRVLTDGVVAFRQGIDPMRNNIGDIELRPLNYPRLWQGLFLLGLDQDDDPWLGTLFVALFFAGVVIAPPAGGVAGAVAMCAAVFSPAILLGLERGNTDLPIFFLLALVAAVARGGAVVTLVVVLLAFMLKLYPLAAVLVFLNREQGVAVRMLQVTAALALLYLLFSWSDLLVIKRSTIQSSWISYGMDVPWRMVAGEFPPFGALVRWASLGAVAAWIAWSGWNRAALNPGDDGPALDAFRVGAACYAGTFLLSTNFDYKQMPLLLTLPQLLIWARNPALARVAVARLALAGTYVALWAMMVERLPGSRTGRGIGFVVGELGQWSLFAALVWLLAQTLPAWVANGIRIGRWDLPRRPQEPSSQ
jgi:hypothetical protein